MKTLLSLIAVSLFSTSALAMDPGDTVCLGFPSAANFWCVTAQNEYIEFDIPAGSGCNREPETGLMTTMIPAAGAMLPVQIVLPRTYWNADGQRVVSFTVQDRRAIMQKEIVCMQSEDL